MRSRSIQWKLIAMYGIIVLIVMIVSGIYILWQLETYEYSKIENDLRAVTSSFMEVVFEDEETATIENTLKLHLEKNASFYTDKSTEIYILDTNGVPLFSNVPNNEIRRFSTPAVIAALNGMSRFEKSEIMDDEVAITVMSYAYPLKIEDDIKVILYTRVKTTNVEDTLQRARIIILISIALALVLSVVIGFVFSRTLTEPIKILTNTARKMAKGELFHTVKVKSNDEIGQLTKSFNHMAFELNRTLADISNEKNKLETVFEHVKDGIIAFNSLGNLIHSNKVTYEMLGIKNKINKIEELADILGIEINTEEIFKMRTNELNNYEVKFGDDVLNIVIANYLNERGETEGVIVMLQDITEQNKLENMRKEFVANVSHELRTPLTTVKSYVETLIDGKVDDEEVAKNFLKVIDNETDRMTFLVKDLLELSRFDNEQVKLDLAKTDIFKLFRDISESLKLYFENKKIELAINFPDQEKYAFIDSDRISQVFNNILSNAIKYSDENKKIEVNFAEDDSFITISVKDQGFGIPKEDLPRIFERFYRVDKARSREMGGTGLGLAIAKEIMEAHNGDIRIESEYKKGSTVFLIFSKNVS